MAGRSLVVDGGRGEGDETVVIHQTRSAHARIATGGGEDAALITDSAFGHLGVQLGAGRDRLALGGVAVQGRALFDGEMGDDLLHELAGNQIHRGRVVNFA